MCSVLYSIFINDKFYINYRNFKSLLSCIISIQKYEDTIIVPIPAFMSINKLDPYHGNG